MGRLAAAAAEVGPGAWAIRRWRIVIAWEPVWQCLGGDFSDSFKKIKPLPGMIEATGY